MKISLPHWWRALCEKLPHRFRSHRISFARFSGCVKSNGSPLTILCGATNQNRAYLLDLIFAEPPAEKSQGRPRRQNIFQRRHDEDIGMIIVETKRELFTWLNDGGWFFIPTWIAGEVALPLPDECRRASTFKSELRQIEREGFELEVTRTEERFREFYDQLYVPYATKQFGAAAMVEGYAKKREQCARFDLMLVRRKRQPMVTVAGFIVVYEPDRPKLWSAGVRAGNHDEVRAGALAAGYHFTLGWLQEKGFTRASLGKSRAFLHDGVLRFKRKFAQQLVPGHVFGFALKIQALTPAVKSFLRDNPFIFQSGEKFHAAIFTDAVPTVDELVELEKKFFHHGLERIVVYYFNETSGTTRPPTATRRAEVRPAAELISGRLHLP